MTDGAVTPRPSAKQLRDSFEQPTVWGVRAVDPDPAVVVFLHALQPERKAA